MVSDPDADGLYGLPLEEFTPARDALAGRLRSAGDAEEAKRVKALRKPTTPAWAVNQLARRQRPLVEELIAASDRLRAAQQSLLHGGPAQEVWEATLAERDILARLIHEAGRVLEAQSYGASRTTLDRISETLAAAAADVREHPVLRRGILITEMHRTGFEAIFTDTVGAEVPDLPAPKASRTKAAAKPAAGPALRSVPGGPSARKVLEAERDEARLARAADRAEEDADRLERAAVRSEEGAEAARRRLAASEKEAARARADATAARKAAKAARRDAERAAARLKKLAGPRRGSAR